MTCDDLTEIGSDSVAAMTLEEIYALGDQDVMDCLSMFGAITSWSTAQKQALLTVLKKETVCFFINCISAFCSNIDLQNINIKTNS